MLSNAGLLLLIEALSLGVLFWLFPFVLAKKAVKAFGGRWFKPADAVLKELPGAVTGLVLGALGVLVFGVSFEEYAVKQAKAAGDKGMELVGLGPLARCKSQALIDSGITPLNLDGLMKDYKFSMDRVTVQNEVLYYVGALT